MYDNIGGKIKVLAKVIVIFAAIIILILGLIALNEIAEDSDHMSDSEAIAAVLITILTMAIEFAVAWISSWFLYGVGELIESTCEIRDILMESPYHGLPIQEKHQQKFYSSQNP